MDLNANKWTISDKPQSRATVKIVIESERMLITIFGLVNNYDFSIIGLTYFVKELKSKSH